ncbi:sodium:proton antiporter [Phormidium willei BDU 130791]|nr:sodium:proton antiporter [Phormidium willei BDU 130791]
MENFGALALIPTLAVIVLAVLSRRALESLVGGVIVGQVMISQDEVMQRIVASAQTVLADGTIVWILLAVSLFGALTHLVVHSGGAQAFAGLLIRICRTRRSSLIATWALGLLIFIDDYLNALTVGASMKRVTDSHRVSRPMLSYVVDSTAAPICVLVPLSTWAVYVSGLLEINGVAEAGQGVVAYISSIPYMIYPLVAVLLVPLVAIGLVPALGAMKRAEARAYAGESTATAVQDEPQIDFQHRGAPRLHNFLVPIVSLIFFTWWFEVDILMGVTAALVISVLLYGLQGTLKVGQMFDLAMEGVKGMVPAIAIIVASFMLKEVNDILGLTDFVIETVSPLMTATLLPPVAFLTLALIAFATGSFWGMYAIALPIILPLGLALDMDAFLLVGVVVSAGAFGSHACFYGDSTVLSASSSDVTTMDHALTQLPYVLIAAGLSALAYFALGLV